MVSEDPLQPYSPAWEQRLPVIPQIQVTLNCNLACTYCFQKHAGGIIDLDTVAAILRAVVAHNLTAAPGCRTMPVYWHGGEPLLAGLDFFRQVLHLQAQYPEVSFDNRLQTNGTLMNAELAGWFTAHRFHVGFSLDGPRDLHDRHRWFRGSGLGSFDAVMQGIVCYRRHFPDTRLPVIAVVTKASIPRAGDIFHFFRDLRADVQLDIYDIRWLDLMAGSGMAELAPSAAEVGQFLIELFDLWFYDQQRHVDFQELRQEIKMILQPEVDRGDPFHKKRCDLRRLIFSPHGRVFSCDQWVHDECAALGDIHRDSLALILKNKADLWAAIKTRLRRSGDDMACGPCDWGRQCGGGCLTCMKYNALLLQARSQGLPDHRWVQANLPPGWETLRGETYYCDGLRAFRQHVQETVRREFTNAN